MTTAVVIGSVMSFAFLTPSCRCDRSGHGTQGHRRAYRASVFVDAMSAGSYDVAFLASSQLLHVLKLSRSVINDASDEFNVR